MLIKDPVPVEETAEDENEEVATEAEDEAAPDTATEEEATAPDASEADAEDAPEDDKMPLPDHGIQWIDFGMMGVLTQQQRQILLDLVTAIVMQDAYSLKRTVLKTAQPKGEIDHGALLELCEGMCDQYTGSDFGDFDLGDLLGTVLSSLQDEEYDIDPFLTNLSRGIIAAEGTVKALSPRINILNYFIDKVDIGAGLNFDFSNMDDEELAELNGPIAMELLKFFDSTSRSSAKTAETLDMLEKGQIRVRTDLSFEDKALSSVERIAGYAIRALLIIAILIGSCLLCTVPMSAKETTPFLIAFPVLGSIGYVVCIFFAYRLNNDMKKSK